MKILHVIPAILIWAGLTGCREPHADLSEIQNYRLGTITFDYPKNWELSEDMISPGIHYLLVETPGDALVILQSYPTQEAEKLAAFSRTFSEGAAEEMPVGDMMDSTFTNLPEAQGYQWIAEKFRVKLLGESIPHRRLYGTKEMGDRQVFLIFQVASEDYLRSEPGFNLIRNSLRPVEQAGQGTP